MDSGSFVQCIIGKINMYALTLTAEMYVEIMLMIESSAT